MGRLSGAAAPGRLVVGLGETGHPLAGLGRVIRRADAALAPAALGCLGGSDLMALAGMAAG